MKRFGFAGGNASHGATKSHRSAGSIGACQDPGRVWKGKKMAGQMGNKRATVQSLVVYKIDAQRNLIYVKGPVPGKRGTVLEVYDSKIRKYETQPPRPSPTFLGCDIPRGALYMAPSETNPYDYKE